MRVHWYPGHMASAKRRIRASLQLVDACIEVVDARAPASSRNPELAEMARGRALLVVLAKADLAEPESTARWLAYLEDRGEAAAALDLRDPSAPAAILSRLRGLVRSGAGRPGAGDGLLAGLPAGARLGLRTGAAARPVRALVVGIPNVGKSTLINLLAKRAATRTGARPGVTRGPQWIRVTPWLELLDTPGIFWPRLEDPEAGLKLAWIGAVPDEVIDVEQAARHLLAWLAAHRPEACEARYGLSPSDQVGPEALEALARARGLLHPGGRPDAQGAAAVLLRDFRLGRLGPVTLDPPPGRDG